MISVLKHIPDMSVLTGAEIDEAVQVALERVAGKDTAAELAEVAKAITNQADRYWTAVYVMIIALADGTTDWREVRFLETMKSTFQLSDNQMDVAMKTASQFPAVELGGTAPN